MYRHAIPVNIQDNGNFGNGFLKKRNTVEAAIILGTMFLIFKYALAAVPFFLKTILFVSFAIMPAILAIIGIGNESLSEALITFRNYSKMKSMLPYSLAAYGVEPKKQEEEKLSPKEKKKLKAEKKQKRKKEEIERKAQKKTDKIHKKTEKKIEKRKRKKK